MRAKLFALLTTIATGLLAVGAAHADNRFEADTTPTSGAKIGRAIINATGQIAPMLTCRENGKGSIDIAFVMPRNFVGNSSVGVTVRFDDAKPFKVFGTLRDQSVYLDHVMPKSPEGAVLVGLKTAKHVSVEIFDAAGNRVVDDFDLGDAAPLIEQSIETCGDTNWQ